MPFLPNGMPMADHYVGKEGTFRISIDILLIELRITVNSLH